MKIKKINPPRKFYPTNNKDLCLEDSLHVNVANGETYILNKEISFNIKKWGFIIENNLNEKFYFMGSKITDHLIHVKNKNKLRTYCKKEKQKIIQVNKFLKNQK
tara:strand:- start:2077 stop:2388 length:312 start_codon:yes stop_codon:yes gene_type:complete